MMKNRKINWKWVSILVLLFFLILFSLQNAKTVSVSFLVWSFSVSRIVLMFIVFCVGIIIGMLIPSKR